MENNIKILERNNSIMYYFQELTLGKYDDGDISNFFIKSNDKTKEEYFILTESNDEESITNFISDSILSNKLGENKLSDKNISYDSTNFNIIVLLIERTPLKLEIKTLGILEWLISKTMYDVNTTSFTDALKTLDDKSYNLYVSNTDNIKDNFKEILANDNFHEIETKEV